MKTSTANSKKKTATSRGAGSTSTATDKRKENAGPEENASGDNAGPKKAKRQKIKDEERDVNPDHCFRCKCECCGKVVAIMSNYRETAKGQLLHRIVKLYWEFDTVPDYGDAPFAKKQRKNPVEKLPKVFTNEQELEAATKNWEESIRWHLGKCEKFLAQNDGGLGPNIAGNDVTQIPKEVCRKYASYEKVPKEQKGLQIYKAGQRNRKKK